MRETKKVTEQILRNLARGAKKSIFVPFLSPVGPMEPQSKKEKKFLVFTHRTIPANLKEIRPAVSEIQMLTDGRTKSDDYTCRPWA